MDLSIYHFLFKDAGTQRSRIVAASFIAGMANALFMVIVNTVASDFSEISVRHFLMFLLCIVIYILSKRFALLSTAQLVQGNLSATHSRLIGQVNKLGLDNFDKIGSQTIYRSLVENSEIIYESSRMAVSAASGAVMLLCSAVYVYFLSPAAFWIIVLALATGISVYQVLQRQTAIALRNYKTNENRFFTLLGHFLSGFKELKVNAAKHEDLYQHFLTTNRNDARILKNETEKGFVSSIILSQTLFFILIGSIAFLLPTYGLTTPETTIAIVAVVLFISGPIGIIVDSIPMLSKARMAIEDLNQLETTLQEYDDQTSSTRLTTIQHFNEIRLENLNYSYTKNAHALFHLGPVNLTIKQGEILFITGGNGSGKTTLMKLLAGLYFPQGGSIQVDGTPVTRPLYHGYRSLFSVIFTDFHLFDKLYGYRHVDAVKVEELLQQFKIADKTGYSQEQGFENLDLSTGQRKRIALISAMIEDRPVCLFDEVAADQDPAFREYYYRTFLPQLKSSGKTIIAISHDDRYFDVADQMLTLECGALQQNSAETTS